ncbi:MAG: hypothetical protein KGL39_00845 [Patescibacteria group bacterium]|nr:hypothetical protein [Patescibacteria group bacterium]
MMKTVIQGKRFSDCVYVGSLAGLVEECHQFVGRKELNGIWDEETFWGTSPAVSQLRAFIDGHFAHMISMNLNREK